jgi:hypothetical protein
MKASVFRERRKNLHHSGAPYCLTPFSNRPTKLPWKSNVTDLISPLKCTAWPPLGAKKDGTAKPREVQPNDCPPLYRRKTFPAASRNCQPSSPSAQLHPAKYTRPPESDAAKQRLAHLFQSEGLGLANHLSATIVAGDSSRADRTAAKQNNDTPVRTAAMTLPISRSTAANAARGSSVGAR